MPFPRATAPTDYFGHDSSASTQKRILLNSRFYVQCTSPITCLFISPMTHFWYILSSRITHNIKAASTRIHNNFLPEK